MESYIIKAHKFNAFIMWVFSTVLTITAFFNGGVKKGHSCRGSNIRYQSYSNRYSLSENE